MKRVLTFVLSGFFLCNLCTAKKIVFSLKCKKRFHRSGIVVPKVSYERDTVYYVSNAMTENLVITIRDKDDNIITQRYVGYVMPDKEVALFIPGVNSAFKIELNDELYGYFEK